MADLDNLLAQLNDDDSPNGQQAIEETITETTTAIVPIVENLPVIDVPKHVKNFEQVASEILGSWRADREEAQSAINLLRDLIEETITKSQAPSGTWLEAYVAAIKAKTDANATASKLLDSTLKLIQMSKPTVNVKSTTNTINYHDLNSVLAEPIRDDDV